MKQSIIVATDLFYSLQMYSKDCLWKISFGLNDTKCNRSGVDDFKCKRPFHEENSSHLRSFKEKRSLFDQRELINYLAINISDQIQDIDKVYPS